MTSSSKIRPVVDIPLNISKYTISVSTQVHTAWWCSGFHIIMELPEAIQKNKYSLLNIETHEDQCFLYACAAQRFPITDP